MKDARIIMRVSSTKTNELKYCLAGLMLMLSVILLTIPALAAELPDCENTGPACRAACGISGPVICGFGECHDSEGDPGTYVCYRT